MVCPSLVRKVTGTASSPRGAYGRLASSVARWEQPSHPPAREPSPSVKTSVSWSVPSLPGAAAETQSLVNLPTWHRSSSGCCRSKEGVAGVKPARLSRLQSQTLSCTNMQQGKYVSPSAAPPGLNTLEASSAVFCAGAVKGRVLNPFKHVPCEIQDFSKVKNCFCCLLAFSCFFRNSFLAKPQDDQCGLSKSFFNGRQFA